MYFNIRANTPLYSTIFLAALFFISLDSKASDLNVLWKKNCPNNSLCFEHPATLLPINIKIIDSDAGKLIDENMTLHFDLGWYASLFTEMTNATITYKEINGHQAKILVQENKMALSISTKTNKIRFAMLIEFKKSLDIQKGLRIFNSVHLRLE